MPQHYATHVCITDHAHGRWHLRAPGQREPGSKQIMARLNNMLRLGAPLDERCQLWVPVTARLSAICVPLTGMEGGGWLVTTYKYHGLYGRYNRDEMAQ